MGIALRALLVVWTLAFADGGAAHAKLIGKCGTYRAEGHYLVENGQGVVLLDRGTNSQLRFFADGRGVKMPEGASGVNFALNLTFRTSCDYFCDGSIDKVLHPLDPFSRPKPFRSSSPALLRGSYPIACVPNTRETRE